VAVPNVQLDWQQSAVLAAVLLATSAVLLSGPVGPRRRALAPFVREAGVIAALYSLWMLAGTLAEDRTSGAFARARWINRIQHDLHLPSERTLQDALLRHPWLAQAANIYYATMHFAMLFAFLFWVFWRHRDQYRTVRTTVIGFTALSLLIQFLPVAPPRLLPELGFVDVAARFGQSVYGLGVVDADQLSAMPSVHVGWAVLVGVGVVLISPSRWRWAALAHSVLTILIVSATANHWWADGIVASALLALVVTAQGMRRKRSGRATRSRVRGPAPHRDGLERTATV
jgi:hypothetical protein